MTYHANHLLLGVDIDDGHERALMKIALVAIPFHYYVHASHECRRGRVAVRCRYDGSTWQYTDHVRTSETADDTVMTSRTRSLPNSIPIAVQHSSSS